LKLGFRKFRDDRDSLLIKIDGGRQFALFMRVLAFLKKLDRLSGPVLGFFLANAVRCNSENRQDRHENPCRQEPKQIWPGSKTINHSSLSGALIVSPDDK
jgi:hypothetical protein